MKKNLIKSKLIYLKKLLGFAAVESFTYTPLLTQLEERCLHDHKEGIILY